MQRESPKARVEGRREALLGILAARGLTLSEADRSKARSYTESTKLDAMIVRAATAGSAAEVFADG